MTPPAPVKTVEALKELLDRLEACPRSDARLEEAICRRMHTATDALVSALSPNDADRLTYQAHRIARYA